MELVNNGAALTEDATDLVEKGTVEEGPVRECAQQIVPMLSQLDTCKGSRASLSVASPTAVARVSCFTATLSCRIAPKGNGRGRAL